MEENMRKAIKFLSMALLVTLFSITACKQSDIADNISQGDTQAVEQGGTDNQNTTANSQPQTQPNNTTTTQTQKPNEDVLEPDSSDSSGVNSDFAIKYVINEAKSLTYIKGKIVNGKFVESAVAMPVTITVMNNAVVAKKSEFIIYRKNSSDTVLQGTFIGTGTITLNFVSDRVKVVLKGDGTTPMQAATGENENTNSGQSSNADKVYATLEQHIQAGRIIDNKGQRVKYTKRYGDSKFWMYKWDKDKWMDFEKGKGRGKK
jgi:hypothetical protein